jgi:MurNAc alpha-1-phosphate uridylyltransferase
MRAMILAAGRGARMGELTTAVPKPLLRAGGRYLIEYSLRSLVKVGITDIIINVSYHGQQIKDALGNGRHFGANIHYSEEPEALETGGGVFQALPWLGVEPFIVLSSDIVTDYPLQNLPRNPQSLAHLVLVDNPDFHPEGDWCLEGERIYLGDAQRYTFGNIGVYRPELFAHATAGHYRLSDIFTPAIQQQLISGEVYRGFWRNIGKPGQLIALADNELMRSMT